MVNYGFKKKSFIFEFTHDHILVLKTLAQEETDANSLKTLSFSETVTLINVYVHIKNVYRIVHDRDGFDSSHMKVGLGRVESQVFLNP